MEDLTPEERALARLDSLQGDDTDGADEPGGDGAPSPTERAQARLEELRGGAPGPSTEDTPSAFFPDESGTLGGAGSDSTGATAPSGGEFEAAGVSVGEQSARMNALSRLQQQRNQAPERVEADLQAEATPDTSTTATAPGDPGIDPGDQSKQQEEAERSALDQAIETGITISAAVQPGTRENLRMMEAIANGFRQTYAQANVTEAAGGVIQPEDRRVEGKGGFALVNLVSEAVQGLTAATIDSPEDMTDGERAARAEAARSYAESIQTLSQIPRPESVQRTLEAEGIFGTLKEAAKDPHVVIPNLVASSSLQSLPAAVSGIAGAAAGPVGAFAGQFFGTLNVEQQAAMGQALAEAGVDVRNPRDILAATADPEKRREIKRTARNRGLGVALVDGLFGAASMGLNRVGMSKLLKGTGGFVLESAGEGFGEVGGQIAGGEEVDRGEATVETLAGMGQSGATAIGQTAMSELLPSENRVANELRRQVDEGEVTVERPEEEIVNMMERAVNNGAVEQPETAAERAIDEAINNGEITVERPDPKNMSDQDVLDEAERLAERHRQELEEAGVEGALEEGRVSDVDLERLNALENEIGLRMRDEGTAEGFRLSDQWQPVPEGAEVPGGAETFETSSGRTYARREDAVGRRQATAATGQGGPTESTREPSTPRQRLAALGVAVEGLSPNKEDVADLEDLARQAENMDAAELESRIETIEERIEDTRRPPEEREGPIGQDVAKLEAGRAILDRQRTELEAEETEGAEPEAEDETEGAPEAGEEAGQFAQDVQNANPGVLEAAAQNENLSDEEAQTIRAEANRRREAGDLDDQRAEAILQALPEQRPDDADVDEADTDETDTDEADAEPLAGRLPDVSEDLGATDEDGDPVVTNEVLLGLAEDEDLGSEQAETLRDEVQRRREAGTLELSQAQSIRNALPTTEAEDDLAGPPRADLEEGETFVDVGGTEPVEVTIVEPPNDRTVRVEKADPDTPGFETFETTALIQNLRRPEDVEAGEASDSEQDEGGTTSEAEGRSSFPVANVQDSGRAVLSEEWQIIPEHATIPEAAEVRHDLGTADLPVARLPGAQEEGESLSQMGRRSQSREEQRIDQEVASVEQELQQAKQELEDLKARRPEQQESQGEQSGLFGSEEAGQQGGQQQALGGEFEQAGETTERLQQMIDEKEDYIRRLQDKLVDLRQGAPDAQSEARRSQRDITDEAEDRDTPDGQTSGATETSENATAPRSMTDMQTVPQGEFSDPDARDLRAGVIEEDLFTVIRDQWRQPGIEDAMNTIATTVDRIRELRAAEERGMIGSNGVERDVANMRDMIDRELEKILPSLESAEASALEQRVRAWTGQTGVPSPAATHHLNNVAGRDAFPTVEMADGYEVRMSDAGTIEVISPNTGNPIDGRSSRYDDVLLDYFRENSEAIDQAPRVTDTDPDIGMGQWADAVASASQNPFEIVEAVVVKRQEASHDPVEQLLAERAPFSTSSLDPFVSGDEIFEQGLANWVESGGSDINNVSRDAQQRYDVNVTPQEIVDNYLRPNPGGVSAMQRNPGVDRLVDRFRNVTGLDVDLDFMQQVYDNLYDGGTTQATEDNGTEAPFSPSAAYTPRSTNRRSNGYTFDGVRYRRDPSGRSLRERAEEGYELRPGAPEQAREDGLLLMDQLSLFGPPEGETQGETEMRENGQAEEAEGETTEGEIEETTRTTEPGEIGTTEDPSDLTRPTTEEVRRMESGLLARGITDDLSENHSASLVGRTIAGPDDLAALAQVYRDPRFETFRVFFVREREDGSEEIVHQQGVSSRLPGTTSPFAMEVDGTAYLPEDVSADNLTRWEQFSYWLSHNMDANGADGYYFLHNHPSGSTNPSDGDKSVTKSALLEQEGMKGHVIIDSGEYTVLQTEARFPDLTTMEEARAKFRERTESEYETSSRRKIRDMQKGDIRVTERTREITDPEVLRRAQIEPFVERVRNIRTSEGVVGTMSQNEDRLLEPSIDHPALDHAVTNVPDLIEVAKRIEETNNPLLITRGSNGIVRGVMEVDPEFLSGSSVKEASRQVLTLARHTGGHDAFIANVPENLLEDIQRLMRHGVFTDYVTENGKSRGDHGLMLTPDAKHRDFGFKPLDVGTSLPLEEGASYGDNLRDEIRRRVGRLQHNSDEQLSPHAESGPAGSENIRQAAVRIEGDLYRGRTHPDALQAAVDDGALQATDEGQAPTLPDGRSLEEAEKAGDIDLGLFTTSEGRVVQNQGTSHVLGVDRADQASQARGANAPSPTPRGPLQRPPSPRAVSRRLAQLDEHGLRVEASKDLPPGANSVDVTLESISETEENRQGIEKALNDEALNLDNPVSAPAVIRSFIDVVRAAGREVPVRYGRYRGFSFDTAGVFKVQPEVIRLKEAGDVSVAAHEMGHALEKAVFDWVEGSAWQRAVAGTDGLVQEELVRLGKELYGDQEPAGGYKREGWAEFIKFYLLNRQRVQDRSPAVLDWFESEFLPDHPEIAAAMETARTKGRNWFDQGSVNRAQAQVQKRRSWWENFKRTVTTETGRERLKTEVSKRTLTEFSPLLRLVEEAEERMGRSLDVDENPFLTAEALQKTHAARTRMMVEQGTFDFAGNPKGAPLRDAAQIVKGQRDEFTLYLWARRALKLWEGREAKYDEDGNKIQTSKEPRNPGLAKDDAEYIFEYYDSPEFRQAAEMVYQWNKDVLDYTKAAFDPQMAEQVKKGDVGDYVPLQRVFGDLDEQVIEARDAATGGAILGGDPINALEGSSRRIRDPFQTMIEQAEQLIRATHERYLLNQLVALGKNVQGMGRFIEKVPRDQVPTRIDTDRIVEDLRDQGLTIEVPQDELNRRIERLAEQADDARNDLSSMAEIEEQAREELMEEKMTEFMTFFKPAMVPEGGGDPIVSIQNPETGDVEWFELSRNLYDTFQGLDIYRLPGYLDLIFGNAARLKRLGTTGLRASFALITNPIRDLATFYAQSRSSQNPGSMFAGYTQAMKAGLESVVKDDIEVDPAFERFMRLGGSISRPLGIDTQSTKRAVRELFSGRAMKFIDVSQGTDLLTTWTDALRDVFQIPESAPRVAELKARAKEIGYEPGTRMKDAQAIQLLLDSKRVTTDFSSQGEDTKKWNQMVPFITATIGGQRAFVRAFQQNPKRAIAAATTLAASTLAYWWRIKDEPWYRDMPYREKFNNWFFPINDGTVFVIPRPFEWGVTFSAIPEALADAWYRQEPETVEQVMGHVYQNWSPLGSTDVPGLPRIPITGPVPIEVAAEQLANERFYFDGPIVPRGEERKPAQEQFGSYTSTVAIQVGRAFDVSPRRIDHLIAGFVGGVGRDATESLDALLSVLGVEGSTPNVQREQTAADAPVFGKLFRPGGKPGVRSKAVDDFYETLQEYQKRQASDVQEETWQERQTRLMLGDAQTALSLMFWLRRNTQDDARRRNLQREVRAIAQDAVKTAEEGIEAVQQKRGELGGMTNIYRNREEFNIDQLRPIIEAVNPQAIDELDERQAQEAEENPTADSTGQR